MHTSDTSNEWQFIFSHQMATVNCSQSRQLIILEVGHRQEWTLKGQGWHYGATGQVAIITHSPHTKRITDAELIFTARCTLVQSAVLRSHVVCLSVCNVGEL